MHNSNFVIIIRSVDKIETERSKKGVVAFVVHQSCSHCVYIHVLKISILVVNVMAQLFLTYSDNQLRSKFAGPSMHVLRSRVDSHGRLMLGDLCDGIVIITLDSICNASITEPLSMLGHKFHL